MICSWSYPRTAKAHITRSSLEIQNHVRNLSIYSHLVRTNLAFVDIRVQLPSWWHVQTNELSIAEYVDGTSKHKQPHTYPTTENAGPSRNAFVIQREFTLIASQCGQCWIGIFLVENIHWPGASKPTTLRRANDAHNNQHDILTFGYEKDTHTYASLQKWLLEYIERDQMLAMTYMLRYMANTWREIIAGWTDSLEQIVSSHPSMSLVKAKLARRNR